VPRTPFARARTSLTLRTSGLALFVGLFSLYIRSLLTLMHRTSERSWDATFSKFSALVYFLAYFPLQRHYMLTFAIFPLIFSQQYRLTFENFRISESSPCSICRTIASTVSILFLKIHYSIQPDNRINGFNSEKFSLQWFYKHNSNQFSPQWFYKYNSNQFSLQCFYIHNSCQFSLPCFHVHNSSQCPKHLL
jgi:hypothetical protein